VVELFSDERVEVIANGQVLIGGRPAPHVLPAKGGPVTAL
jgi:hypothetical protein